MTKKQPLIAVVGPTASGKTAVGIALAKKYNGEVISADSMQIYKGLDITTAKPTPEEMGEIPHHLLSFVPLEEKFSVAGYIALAKEKIAEIASRGKLPIIVGGTGLYINSLIDNINFDNAQTDGKIREEMELLAEEIGNEAMWEKLREIDPDSAELIPPNNIIRIIRALEIYKLTGTPFSEYKLQNKGSQSDYNVCFIGLNYENRADLYDRINKRVDVMVENGMIDECLNIYEQNINVSAAIGYKEFIPYFEKNAELSVCLDKIKQNSRRYAKRQLTWFRKDDRINWVLLANDTKFKKIIEYCEKIVAKSEFM